MGLLLRFTLRHGFVPCLGREKSTGDAKCDNAQIPAFS
jgi:hypothetical protein